MELILHFPVGLVLVMGVDEGEWGGGGGAGPVNVEEVMMPEIKCCQYLSLRAK